MTNTAMIFHGMEGHDQENWFPWLKSELETHDFEVNVPNFPSPPVVAPKLSEWFEVLEPLRSTINEETILIGHSLGGIFTLRVLESLEQKVAAVYFVAVPIGVKPILNYDRDKAYSGFEFDWEKIKTKANKFTVYHSDDDPYVDLKNGETLPTNLDVNLTFIPNAGHFNTKAGYTKFPKLLVEIVD